MAAAVLNASKETSFQARDAPFGHGLWAVAAYAAYAATAHGAPRALADHAGTAELSES